MINNYNEFLLEDFLKESIMNEKINIDSIKKIVNKFGKSKESLINLIKKFNNTKDIKIKKILGYVLILMILGNFVIKNNKWNELNKYDDVEKMTSELIEISNEKDIDIEDIKFIINDEKIPILSLNNASLINNINKIKPNLLNIKKVNYYDRYDKEIYDALKELENKGEKPNMNLIKTIMIIETGMNPRKNNLGYEGFPQTKKYIVNGWKDKDGIFHPGINQIYGTNFTMKDMYDAGKSAQFIYYYLKSIKKSIHVDNIYDMIIAYNWGTRNLGKYKNGELELPKQSEDYVDMYKEFEPFFNIKNEKS